MVPTGWVGRLSSGPGRTQRGRHRAGWRRARGAHPTEPVVVYLESAPVSLPDAAMIRALMGHEAPELEVFDEIDSTNTWLLSRAFGREAARPRLAVAARQTAGRGRRGRSWIAQPGRSACLSLAFESPSAPAPGLALAIGCAVAEALSALTDGISLKWPNDLLRRGLKCGGILIESGPGRLPAGPVCRVVAGIGLNLLAPSDNAMIERPAGGLFDEERDRPSAEAVIATAAQACAQAYAQHCEQGLAPFLSKWARFDAWRGRPVEVSDAGRVLVRGISLGITAEGALRLDTQAGEQVIVSGDLSLRGTGQA